MGVQNDTNQFDLFGRFQDEKLQSEYVIYCLEQKWKYSFAIIVTLILTLAVIETVVGTWFNEELTVEGVEIRDVEIYGIVSLCLIAIAGASGAALVWNTFDDTNQSGRNLSSFYQIIFMLSFNLLFILKTIKQIHLQIPDCIPRQYSFTKTFHDHEFNSSSSSEFHQLALLSADSNIPPVCSSHSLLALTSRPMVLMLSFTPHILMGIIYEPRLYLVLACQIPSAVLISYSIYDSLFSFPPILLSFIILMVHLVGLHFQRAQSFLNQRKVQQLLEENEKNADANLAMEMKHMISNIAHDLKTPLASFSSGIDVIREILLSVKHQLNATRTAETEKPIDIVADCFNSMEVCLKNIHNTNAFMLMTINRCIDYTKASKGMKLVPKYETVDLREALQFPIECMSNIQERIGIKVEALSEEICSHIITDKQWLQENLLCLLSNAVKYSTEGSVTITARLTANSDKVVNPAAAKYATQSSSRKTYPEITSSTYRSNEEFIIFEVEDTGIGLSEEAMKNLFNPFKQAQRLAGGTGLGLYSLAKRMEALKGQYGVRKREDGKQGSLFWFSIPYKPDKIEANEKSFVLEQTSLRLFSTGTPGKTIKVKTSFRVLDVLVVDDAPSILKMSSMMLKRQGHEIWTAENGEIALKRMEEKWRVNGKGFDLVLMDLQMPVMDGLEATRRLRGMEAEGREWMNPGFHHLVIGLSANTDNETSEEAFKSGMNDLFEKPFSFTAMNKIFDRFFQ